MDRNIGSAPNRDLQLPLLTVDTVAGYVRELDLLPSDERLEATEVTGGSINFSFRVTGLTNSVFVKQTPGFIKILGPSAKLSKQRLRIERETFSVWKDALGPSESEVLACLPHILYFDEDRMIMVMEDLRSYVTLQDQFSAGVVDVVAARKVGRFLGCVHAKTHSVLVTEEVRKDLSIKFINQELRKLQLEQFFAQPYQMAPGALPLRSDDELMAAIDELKALYSGEKLDNLALCHGDFHAGSVMVNVQDRNSGMGCSVSAKVIDTEFAIYGPPGLDVGCLIASYVLSCVQQAVVGADPEQIRAFSSAIAAIWDAYRDKMRTLKVPEANLDAISSDAVGFAGCEVARNALYGLPVSDKDKKKLADETAIALAVKFIKERAHGVGRLLVVIDEACCSKC
jgi:5-methylthioribose kinase